MRIRDLDWILALAEHRHMTTAAAELRVPQPTLSRALGRVEAELDAQIFVRHSGGLRLTPLGERVALAAKDLTGRYDRLLSEINSQKDPDTGTVRLAFLESTAAALLPRLLARFREIAPNVRIVLEQEPAHEIAEDLDTFRADIGLTSAKPSGSYGWVPLYIDRLVLAVARGHRLATQQHTNLSSLQGEAFITTPLGFGFRAQTDGLLHDAGVSPEIAFESPDPTTITGLVAAGLGVAIVPAAYAARDDIVGIDIDAAGAVRRIGMTWRTDVPLPGPAARLQELVAAEFAGA